MNLPLTTKRRSHNFNMEYFQNRLTARLCCILVCTVQIVPRLSMILRQSATATKTQIPAIISLPFPLLMTLVIGLEYFLFKKLGPGIVKYSNLVDCMLLLCFLGDWLLVVITYAHRIHENNPPCFRIDSLYGFTTFSWRTLFVTLLVQKWQLKVIAPVVATLVATGYVVYYSTESLVSPLLSAGIQLLNIVLIVYCEDKVKWKLVFANMQQEKWMQVNNFILNSIPENIMILDLKGEVKFISEYCKSFINKNSSEVEDAKDFFKRIQNLHQQKYPFEFCSPATPSTTIMHMEKLTEDKKISLKFEALENLIQNFETIIRNKDIEERQFLVYDGKLKLQNDQQEKSIEIKISFINHFDNDYIILMLRDMTQRDVLVTLESTNKYKDQLLASVSHELRAPLNGNINLVETAINSPAIPETIKENLLVPALRSSKFLLHIINDILDMSQINEKKLRLVFQSGDLKDTLKSTAQLVELQAKKKGIQLQLEIDPNLPKKFSTDHIRLSQIVLNLLNNAVKFTREGVVKMKASPMLGVPWVKISIEDTGIGMTQENIKKLFSSYTHIDFEGRQVMNPQGVGLGLKIAYSLAALLAPKAQLGITVTSVPEKGSTFTFILEDKDRIPIQFEEQEDDGDKSRRISSCEVSYEVPRPTQPIFLSRLMKSSNSSLVMSPCGEKSELDAFIFSSCSCSKVLLVDDNPFNIMAFETILNSLGVKCDSVYSGFDCIKTLLGRQRKVCGNRCKQYAVVFMDQEMPEMSGIETVEEMMRLQGDGLLSGMKVIGCTAHKSKEQVDKFLEAGIDQCIHKPISNVMIRDILKGIVL